ncbi:MAG: EAL domain-containing protein [Treponema sp.]|nr:EAL domain-containing protein [Treponema sp.]
MVRIITFDICSLLTLAILLLSIFLRKLTRGKSNVLYILLIVIVFLSGVFDILRVYMPLRLPYTRNSQIQIYVYNYLYFITRNLSTPVYILFIFSVCGMWHEFNKDVLLKITWGVPVIAIIFLIVMNIPVHKLFVITENLEYVRGPWLMYMRICAVWILAYSVICLLFNRQMISRQKFFLLLSLCPINVIGVLIQQYWPKYLVEILCTTFPLIFISIAVQKPEEIIDMTSGSLNFQAYKDEIKRNLAAKRKLHFIIVKIIDYDIIRNTLGKENITIFLSHVVRGLYTICNNDEYDVYYLGNGGFSILTLRDNSEEIEQIALKTRNFFAGKHEINNINIMFDFKMCFVRCPEDLKDYDAVMNFDKNIMSSIIAKNTLVYLKEISNSSDFQISNQIDRIIQQAIKYNQFEMYFQPVYDIKARQFVSAEALIRLNNSEYGFISPSVFIPAAEKSGAIHEIGDFVLEDVISFVAENNLDELGLKYIEINLSVSQCIENNLSEKIMDLLTRYKVNPEKINLEITETSQEVNYNVIEQNITSLSQNGILISLDDYGTGYSNILRITRLPLDLIKLDKSFVDELEKPGMKTVINETVSMLKKMNKQILIEGVETYEDFDYFRNAGCDFVQGFYFSKPLSKADFIEFMRSSRDE